MTEIKNHNEHKILEEQVRFSHENIDFFNFLRCGFNEVESAYIIVSNKVENSIRKTIEYDSKSVLKNLARKQVIKTKGSILILIISGIIFKNYNRIRSIGEKLFSSIKRNGNIRGSKFCYDEIDLFI